jgi:hypothetical protein
VCSIINSSVDLPIDDEVLVMLVTDKQAKNILGQVTVALKEIVHRQEDEELDDELMSCTTTPLNRTRCVLRRLVSLSSTHGCRIRRRPLHP